MKSIEFIIKQIVVETAQDERFLQKVGNQVSKWVDNFKSTNKGKLPQFVEPGTLGTVTGLTGSTDAQKHLLDLGLIFLLFRNGVMGAYRPAKGEWGGDIGLNIQYLASDFSLDKTKRGQAFKHHLRQHENDISSTVAHELRHALDDYLSKGKFDQSSGKQDYWDNNVELNAFFTQALNSLQKMIDQGTVNQDNLEWAIKRVFNNSEFISRLRAKNDPRVKRLYSRAYNYFKNITVD
jgi:hypothetical protein